MRRFNRLRFVSRTPHCCLRHLRQELYEQEKQSTEQAAADKAAADKAAADKAAADKAAQLSHFQNLKVSQERAKPTCHHSL